jgi:hypothetical protein
MACCRMQRDASVSLPRKYCACGQCFGIVFGEADPPWSRSKVERVVLNALANSLVWLGAPQARQNQP